MKALNYFKALADGTRLRIFHLLLDHELSVNEIVSILGMGQSRVSRHLKILSESGLLSSRRDGLWVFYRWEPEDGSGHLAALVKGLGAADPVFGKDLEYAAGILADRSASTKKFFNSIAKHWDHIKRDIYGEFDVAEAVLKKVPRCDVAVDMGCGTGDLAVRLVEKAQKVIGIDSSPEMLEEARKRFSENSAGIELRLGELEHVPVRDADADVAVAVMTLHHLSEPRAGIREAHRILKPGKTLIIAELDKHIDEYMREHYGDRWLGFDRGEMESWLEETGFLVKEQEQYRLLRSLALNLYVAEKS